MQEPTDPALLECLAIFEAMRRLGAPAAQIFFANDVGNGRPGMVIGQHAAPASCPSSLKGEELNEAWAAATEWWNAQATEGPENAQRVYQEWLASVPAPGRLNLVDGILEAVRALKAADACEAGHPVQLIVVDDDGNPVEDSEWQG